MKKKAICSECNKEFERDHWRIHCDKPNYCSRQCSCKVTGRKSTQPWNKGLTAYTSSKVKILGDVISAIHKKSYSSGNRTVWNKGLTKETNSSLAQASITMSKTRNTPGPWRDWWKSQMSKGQVKAHAAGKYPHTFTKPEKDTWAYMTSIGLSVKKFEDIDPSDASGTWYHQVPIGEYWVADFACISSKQIVECNGCYIHGHRLDKCEHRTAQYGWSDISKRNRKKDIIKTAAYVKEGWTYALVWECEAERGDFHRVDKMLRGESLG